MTSNYLVWRYQPKARACRLEELTGIESGVPLRYGETLAATFPKKANFRMDRDRPRDTLLLDAVSNVDALIVAAPRLRAVLEEESLEKVEYLPVAISDHKKKIASKDYVIVHPIEPVDCIDQDESVLEWSVIDTEKIEVLEKLVIDENRIPKTRKLFRVHHIPDVILAHRSLVSRIEAARITGVQFVDIDKFKID
jgi:hypothetical protein